MFSRKIACLGVFLALFMVAGLPVAAQAISGAIRGTVVDPSGAAVPQAKIMAENVGQKTMVTGTTDDSGNFVIPNLPAATYRLTVQKAGFKAFVKSGIVLNAFTNVTVGNITLAVGAVT